MGVLPKSYDSHSFAANYLDCREQTLSFEELGANRRLLHSPRTRRPERVAAATAMPSLFQALGARPALGRLFLHEEGEWGASRVVLLSHGLWRRRFGGDPGVVGRTIKVNGSNVSVVGVLPPDFIIAPRRYEIYASMTLSDQQKVNRRGRYLTVLARLKPGVTEEQARAEMRALGLRLSAQHQDENAGRSAAVYSLERWITGGTRTALLLLLGAVSFTLLIACATSPTSCWVRPARAGRDGRARGARGRASAARAADAHREPDALPRWRP